MKISDKKIQIISRSSSSFADRQQAGRLLALELLEYKGKNAVVIGIPRGGMVIAGIIASGLTAELDIVIARKLRSPMNPELAMGAVAETGEVFFNDKVAGEEIRISHYAEREKEYQLTEIRRRIEIFRAAKPKIALEDRIVIITDDGLATGATMQAAIWSARREKPKLIVVALPVAPEDSLKLIAADADRAVCLRVPPNFFGVGQFYDNFVQIEDSEVLEILKGNAG